MSNEEPLKVQFDDHSFFIPANEDGVGLCGHKVRCNKCKRKIFIQLPLFGVPHHFDAFAVCGDCLEIDDEFRKMYPELAADLQKWKGEK